MGPITEWTFANWFVFAAWVAGMTGSIWLIVRSLEERQLRLDKQGTNHD